MEFVPLRAMAKFVGKVVVGFRIQEGGHLQDDLPQGKPRLSENLRHTADQLAGILVDGGVKQRLFGGKVSVAQPLRDVHFLRNIGDRGFFVSVLVEQPQYPESPGGVPQGLL